ncbi:hypothetical protein [Nonomuraea insulae]|uniref:SPOR domain-containing protein n=1 Tax=Nonomuraea insulae TaxID=1616787 RepID=A0ABW1D285_9ACTN
MRPLPVVLGLLAMVVSCGSEPAASPRYTASLTVLEGGGHGPQLCSNIMQSNPPQCSGPDVVGWDWSKAAHESLRGVKWGEYRVVGTWDGARLTLTEPPGAPVKPPEKEEGDVFASACPEPEGGWRPVDRAKATDQDMDAAIGRAKTAEDYANAYVDRLTPLPAHPERLTADDAENYVLNLRFTGDLAGREEWIRELWGGALCLSNAKHTEAELLAIQRDLEDETKSGKIVYSSAGNMANRVEIGVWVADEELKRRLEDRYGADMISIDGMLKPVR